MIKTLYSLLETFWNDAELYGIKCSDKLDRLQAEY